MTAGGLVVGVSFFPFRWRCPHEKTSTSAAPTPPFTLGHSVAVAELAEEAARRVGLPPEQVLTLRRAGFVHGFGRLGVSNSIWDRPGPLSAGEWERVRMYPYLTERMLHQSAALAPLGEIAVQHRERLDGSGYPRGLSGGAISRPACARAPLTRGGPDPAKMRRSPSCSGGRLRYWGITCAQYPGFAAACESPASQFMARGCGVARTAQAGEARRGQHRTGRHRQQPRRGIRGRA